MPEQLDLFADPGDNNDDPSQSDDTPPPPGPVHDPDDDSGATAVPADQDVRDRIISSLDETLFVEAGAGSGKTRSLVARILDLVVVGGISLRHIAAITFTEKAAAELRDRVRHELEDAAADESRPTLERDRCRAAVNEVDAAAISTLHAFSQRILSEHPIEAGLPPAIEILDEISSQVAFDDRWRDFFSRLLDTPEMENTLLLAFAANIEEKHLRALATAFQDNWDLVAERVPDVTTTTAVRVGPIVDALREAAAQARHGDPGDKMVDRLTELDDLADKLDQADTAGDAPARLRLLRAKKPSFSVSRTGAKPNWTGAVTISEVRDQVIAVGELRDAEATRAIDNIIGDLAATLRDFTLGDVEERRRNGRLEFHDLLVFARQLLRHPTRGWPARQQLQRRYHRILLDEFQDTDPIQIELAVLLASRDAEAGSKPWHDIDIDPGRLFFVGDPKQSIYRFRRADIALFLRARSKFGDTEQEAKLTTNFRTVAPIISWVNGVFGHLIKHEPDSQPEYQPLLAYRPDTGRGPAVAVLGQEPHDDGPKADALRDYEARDVAAAVGTVFRDRWQVYDQSSKRWRDARLGDVTILLPARTSLPALERALDDASIPYRAESSSLVWSTREIRDLMAALRAIDDPTDELSLVTALRSPVYGCGDDDLYRFRVEHRGSWNHQAPLPSTLEADHPVAVGIGHIAELHTGRLWGTPSELIERLIRERRMLELGVVGGRPREVWRRLRFVIDQARAYSDSEGGNLRQFLHWAQLQSSEGARVAETVLPETDDDSVRIMTIHGSKGLEFPITVLSGMTTKPRASTASVQVLFPPAGPAAYKLNSKLTTTEFEAYKPLDEQMSHHERLRLLYVATTRARDHLIVSLHRKTPPKAHRDDDKLTAAELLTRGSSQVVGEAHEFVAPLQPEATPKDQPRTSSLPLMARNEWQSKRDASVAVGARSRTMAATTIAKRAAEAARDPGLDKDARDLDLPPWNKGRYGTAIGRAVHAVLQTIDLATGEALVETASAQAAAEGIIGREDVVIDLVRSALASPTVTEAAALQFWRETYVAAPVEGTVIEGYVDLLYRRPGGLVVVDYKTDAVASEADLDAKLDRYALQGATYAMAVEAAVGEPVAEMVFLFLARDRALARSVTDLRARIEDVRAVVRQPT